MVTRLNHSTCLKIKSELSETLHAIAMKYGLNFKHMKGIVLDSTTYKVHVTLTVREHENEQVASD